MKAIDLHSITKKSGLVNKYNKIKRKEAKWPYDYIVRMEDDDPQFDTLEVSEFVSGYLSIMEEVVPVTPDNAKLLAHLHYLRQLMDDCVSFDWNDVRSTHRQVLMAIELIRLKWEDTAGVKEAKALALSRIRHNRPMEMPTAYQQPDIANTQQPQKLGLRRNKHFPKPPNTSVPQTTCTLFPVPPSVVTDSVARSSCCHTRVPNTSSTATHRAEYSTHRPTQSSVKAEHAFVNHNRPRTPTHAHANSHGFGMLAVLRL